jgi:hypothetical protein
VAHERIQARPSNSIRKAQRRRQRPPMRIAIWIATSVLCILVLGYVVGPTKCSEGWQSPSIGRQGAFSWHGGLNHAPDILRLLGSLLGAFVVSTAYQSIRNAIVSKRGKSHAAQDPVRSVQCPKCKAPMTKRLARRGRYAGNYFWGCSRFLACKGIR